MTILPNADPHGNHILWGSLVDSDPTHYSFASCVKYFTMTSEVFQLEHGTVPGFIVVYDVKNLSFSHLLKTPLPQVSKYTSYAQVRSLVLYTALGYTLNSVNVFLYKVSPSELCILFVSLKKGRQITMHKNLKF